MLPQHAILIHSLSLSLFLPFTNADVKPYYRSTSYDRSYYGAWPQQSYHSSSLSGPILNYWHRSRACEDGGYTLIAPRGDSVRHKGPMILDQNGDLVWFKEYGTTYNLNIHTFQGEDYLTFWTGNDGVRGHGNGVYYMVGEMHGPSSMSANLIITSSIPATKKHTKSAVSTAFLQICMSLT